MKGQVRILKYQAGYPGLNKKLYTGNPKAYQVALIHIRLEELQGRGMKILKASKPNSDGTQITFVPLESAEEYKEELERILQNGKEIGVKFEKIKRESCK